MKKWSAIGNRIGTLDASAPLVMDWQRGNRIGTLDAITPKNEFNPDWDQMAVLVEHSQEQAAKIDALEKQLAEQATTYIEPTSNSGEGWIFDEKKFADLIRADEREACAKVCEDLIGTRAMAVHCADAIRARGNT